MHKEFPDWYRTANLEPKSETIESRWKAIEKFLTKAEDTELLNAARLFLGTPPLDKEFTEKFSDSFRKADATFPASGNEIELRILAGAACIAEFDNKDQGWDRAEMVALAIVAGGYRQQRKKLLAPRIFELCESTLVDRSANRFEAATDGADLSGAIEELKKVCTGANTLQHMEKQLGTFLDRINSKVESTQECQRLLQEEANVLWWLFGGWSNALKIPFGEIDSAALPLIAGNELSGLVEVRPGPVAFPGLLARVLNGSEKSTKKSLAEAVNAAPRTWREQVKATTKEDLLDLCPVRLSIVRSLEVADNKSWIKPTEGASGVPLAQKMAPLDLAVQSFREALLHKYATVESNA